MIWWSEKKFIKKPANRFAGFENFFGNLKN